MPWNAKITLEFCRRWLDKAAAYDGTTVAGAFDKFFSLFVAFNRIYTHLNLASPHPEDRERLQITKTFATTVGPGRINEALQANGGADDLRRLADLIAPGGEFYLISKGRTDLCDEGRNRQLHGRLSSRSVPTKVRAVLEYLYLVRCNMFHGQKDVDKRQLHMLKPAVRCLERVTGAGLSFIETHHELDE